MPLILCHSRSTFNEVKQIPYSRDIQWTAKVLVLQYILKNKCTHRLNTLAQSSDMRVLSRAFERTVTQSLNLKQKSTEKFAHGLTR